MSLAASRILKVFTGALFATSVFVVSDIALTSQSLGVSEAQAGVKSRVKRTNRHKHYKRKNFQKNRISSSGVSLGVRNTGVVQSGRNRTRSFVQRRQDIARRNERVVLENALQSIRRSGAVLANPRRGFSDALVLDPREGVLSSGFGDNGTVGAVTRFRQPCPAKHNCGYRVYSDGTGPRIITPGIPSGNGLPEFDGITGPVIITPYD